MSEDSSNIEYSESALTTMKILMVIHVKVEFFGPGQSRNSERGVDSDSAGFGFEVTGFGSGFEMPGFSHH